MKHDLRTIVWDVCDKGELAYALAVVRNHVMPDIRGEKYSIDEFYSHPTIRAIRPDRHKDVKEFAKGPRAFRYMLMQIYIEWLIKYVMFPSYEA